MHCSKYHLDIFTEAVCAEWSTEDLCIVFLLAWRNLQVLLTEVNDPCIIRPDVVSEKHAQS